MAVHNENMVKRFDIVLDGSIADNYKMDENIPSKEQNPAKMSSQECVEDISKRSIMSKRFNMMWAGIRNAYKQSKDNKHINRGMHTSACIRK